MIAFDEINFQVKNTEAQIASSGRHDDGFHRRRDVVLVVVRSQTHRLAQYIPTSPSPPTPHTAVALRPPEHIGVRGLKTGAEPANKKNTASVSLPIRK